jgi:hypothetical protein
MTHPMKYPLGKRQVAVKNSGSAAQLLVNKICFAKIFSNLVLQIDQSLNHLLWNL